MQTRVLVVAPERDRDALVEWLKLSGFDAHGADSPGWSQDMKRFQPDILLADAPFPAFQSAQFLRAIAAAPQPRRPRLILLTARPVAGGCAQAAVTCLAKPVELSELRECLGSPTAPRVAV